MSDGWSSVATVLLSGLSAGLASFVLNLKQSERSVLRGKLELLYEALAQLENLAN